jgi:hypothetical protein
VHGPQPFAAHPTARLQDLTFEQIALMKSVKCYKCGSPLQITEKFGEELELIKQHLSSISPDFARQQAVCDTWVNKTPEEIALDMASEANSLAIAVDKSNKVLRRPIDEAEV